MSLRSSFIRLQTDNPVNWCQQLMSRHTVSGNEPPSACDSGSVFTIIQIPIIQIQAFGECDKEVGEKPQLVRSSFQVRAAPDRQNSGRWQEVGSINPREITIAHLKSR
jgi:hypothetical protein